MEILTGFLVGVLYVVAAIISIVGTLFMLCFMVVLFPSYLLYSLFTV